MSAVEKFPILLSEAEEESSAVPPCFSDEGINVPLPISTLHLPSSNSPLPPSYNVYYFAHWAFANCSLTLAQYLYIRHNNLYLLA